MCELFVGVTSTFAGPAFGAKGWCDGAFRSVRSVEVVADAVPRGASDGR
jgi:hypothetical protein